MRFIRLQGRALLIAAAVLTAAFMVGCGGDDNPSDGNGGGGGGNNNCTSGGTCRKVTIGTQTWMAENLNIATEDSWCYGEDGRVYDLNGNSKILSSSEIQANCAKYGRMYTWSAAMTACPSGWHLPTNQEWQSLVDYAGGDAGGKKLHTRSGWDVYNGQSGNGTDDFGFAALPGGYCNASKDCAGVGQIGYWWTATEDNNDRAYTREMAFTNRVIEDSRVTILGQSVRCIAD